MAELLNSIPEIRPRDREQHKGDFGRVLVVAGSPGMTGAGCLAAAAAQRAGAGLVTLAVPASLHSVVEVKTLSCMSRPIPETDHGGLGEAAASTLLSWADEFDVFAVGPGLGQHDKTMFTVRRLAHALPVPAVFDADGLNALASAPGVLMGADGPRILTPHPGEMARLLGDVSARDVQESRRSIAEDFAQRWRCVLALKGAGTVVTDGRRTWVNPTGNPGMATGGTGDVLTGIIAGLVAQGLPALDATVLGVFAHGLAGDMAAAENGQLSMIAEDLLHKLPEAFMRIGAGGQKLEILSNVVDEKGRAYPSGNPTTR